MRERYEELQKNPHVVLEALTKGALEAKKVSEAKMEVIRKAIGVA
jgi:hypothetical protein